MPEIIIDNLGPYIGLKIPPDEIRVSDNFSEEGYYSIELSAKYMKDALSTIEKIIDLTPQKKYEILEKSMSKNI